MKTRKVVICIGAFALILLTVFNVYVMINKNEKDKYINSLESELKKECKEKLQVKDNQINKINTRLYEDVKVSNENKVINTTKRFFEFIYDNNIENYSTRKNDAKNYMTDELIDIYFPSASVEGDDLEIEMSDIDVYMKQDSFDVDKETTKVIAVYTIATYNKHTRVEDGEKVHMELVLRKKDDNYVVEEVDQFNTEGEYYYE